MHILLISIQFNTGLWLVVMNQVLSLVLEVQMINIQTKASTISQSNNGEGWARKQIQYRNTHEMQEMHKMQSTNAVLRARVTEGERKGSLSRCLLAWVVGKDSSPAEKEGVLHRENSTGKHMEWNSRVYLRNCRPLSIAGANSRGRWGCECKQDPD